MKYSVSLVILLVSSTTLFSQTQTLHQNLYWLRYYNQIFFTKRLSWINELDNRRFFSPNIENQFIAHSHAQYKIRQLTLGVGCSFSWQYTQDPDKQSVTVPEIRPFQEILFQQNLRKNLSLQHSLRVDERFIRNHTTTELLPGYDFLFRFRYRAQLSYLLKENTNKNTSITIRLSESIFLNDRYNTFDQSRFYIGAIFQLNRKLSLEPGYMYVYQHRLNNNVYLSRPTFRLTLYHRLFLKQAK